MTAGLVSTTFLQAQMIEVHRRSYDERDTWRRMRPCQKKISWRTSSSSPPTPAPVDVPKSSSSFRISSSAKSAERKSRSRTHRFEMREEHLMRRRHVGRTLRLRGPGASRCSWTLRFPSVLDMPSRDGVVLGRFWAKWGRRWKWR